MQARAQRDTGTGQRRRQGRQPGADSVDPDSLHPGMTQDPHSQQVDPEDSYAQVVEVEAMPAEEADPREPRRRGHGREWVGAEVPASRGLSQQAGRPRQPVRGAEVRAVLPRQQGSQAAHPDHRASVDPDPGLMPWAHDPDPDPGQGHAACAWGPSQPQLQRQEACPYSQARWREAGYSTQVEGGGAPGAWEALGGVGAEVPPPTKLRRTGGLLLSVALGVAAAGPRHLGPAPAAPADAISEHLGSESYDGYEAAAPPAQWLEAEGGRPQYPTQGWGAEGSPGGWQHQQGGGPGGSHPGCRDGPAGRAVRMACGGEEGWQQGGGVGLWEAGAEEGCGSEGQSQAGFGGGCHAGFGGRHHGGFGSGSGFGSAADCAGRHGVGGWGKDDSVDYGSGFGSQYAGPGGGDGWGKDDSVDYGGGLGDPAGFAGLGGGGSNGSGGWGLNDAGRAGKVAGKAGWMLSGAAEWQQQEVHGSRQDPGHGSRTDRAGHGSALRPTPPQGPGVLYSSQQPPTPAAPPPPAPLPPAGPTALQRRMLALGLPAAGLGSRAVVLPGGEARGVQVGGAGAGRPPQSRTASQYDAGRVAAAATATAAAAPAWFF